jgi:pantoate--beta-alanine ligase
MTMETAKTIESARRFITAARGQSRTVGLVPTMGALHIGHISLIQAARRQCNYTVVSIFVNPTQFGPSEDFDKYPRPYEDDLQVCREQGVDLVFAPDTNQIYPAKNITWVSVEKLTEGLCGENRPGHFRGVTTVCAKLFNIVQPDVAFFGQKDAQQTVVIKRMVADLNIPLKIQVCPTVREEDGLAVSSRNKYLNKIERKDAPLLYKSLQKAKQLIGIGVTDPEQIITKMKKILAESSLLETEYIEIIDPETLEPLNPVKGPALVALAVRFGQARLIDNILVDAASD